MIIDAHVHLIPDRLRADPALAMADPWFAACHASPRTVLGSPEALLAAMDRDEVDRAVCFTWPFADPALCAEGNDWLAATVRRHPGRLIGFGTVQPADPGAAREALRCARLGLRGLGELNADAQGWSLEATSALRELVRVSVEASLPWTLHCSEPVGREYPGRGTATPGRVAAFAGHNPKLRLILAHLGGGLPLYAHIPEVGALCRSSLWFDTAAAPLVYAPSIHAAIASSLGSGRVMLGSDHPLVSFARTRRHLEDAGLSGTAVASALGDAAARLLEI